MLRAVETRTCAKCGAALLEDASYCISCGSAVARPDQTPPAPGQAQHAARRAEGQHVQSASRIAEAFPLIAAAVLGLAGVVLFVAVLWPETRSPVLGERSSPAPQAPAALTAPGAQNDANAATEATAPSVSGPADLPRSQESGRIPAQTPLDPAPAPEPDGPAEAPSQRLSEAQQAPRSAAAATPGVQAMVDAAIQGDEAQVQQLARDLASRRPARGNRPRARQLNAQGLALMNTARYAEAVPAFAAAHEADAGDIEVRENLGYALLKAGRIEEAERALLEALEIAPRRASAWGSLGFAYAKQGREREAVQLILTAYRFAPNRRKTLESYTRQASTDPDPKVRTMLNAALSRLSQGR